MPLIPIHLLLGWHDSHSQLSIKLRHVYISASFLLSCHWHYSIEQASRASNRFLGDNALQHHWLFITSFICLSNAGWFDALKFSSSILLPTFSTSKKLEHFLVVINAPIFQCPNTFVGFHRAPLGITVLMNVKQVVDWHQRCRTKVFKCLVSMFLNEALINFQLHEVCFW